MKIAFTGAQGTGKTTLMKEFMNDWWKGYTFHDSPTRKLKERGFEINKSGTSETQLELIKIHAENLTVKDFMADRCIIDCYVYGKYQYLTNKIDEETMLALDEALIELAPQYDIIFYLKPEFAIEDDGVRSTDEQFRDDIADLFEETINLLETKFDVNIVRVTGSVKDRARQCIKAIGGTLNARKS